MGDANVKSLQIAVNRYAGVGNFSPVRITGSVDQQSARGAMNALHYIASTAQDSAHAEMAEDLATAYVSTAGAINQAQITRSARDASKFLNEVADGINLPAGYARPMMPTSALYGLAAATSCSPPQIYNPFYDSCVNPCPAGQAYDDKGICVASSQSTSLSAIWGMLSTWQKVVAVAVVGLAGFYVWGQIQERRKPALAGARRR